jgi:hypothetical protein
MSKIIEKSERISTFKFFNKNVKKSEKNRKKAAFKMMLIS